MSLLAALLPFLTGKNEVNLTLSSPNPETIRILIQPKLDKLDGETADETMAIRQSALARPVLIEVPRESDDASIIEQIEKLGQARTPVQAAHDDYLAQLEEANNAAKAAQEAKAKADAEKKSAKPASKATKTSAKAAGKAKDAPKAEDKTEANAEAEAASSGESGVTVDALSNPDNTATPSLF